MANQVRIQKYLSNQGLCSRRKAEEFILKGYVRLNGEVVTQLGTTCDPVTDNVELSAEANSILSKFSYINITSQKELSLIARKQASKRLQIS